MRKLFNDGWMFHMGNLSQEPALITAKTGTCGGASNLTEEEGFVYRLHPHMAKAMHIDNGNHLYAVEKLLTDDWKAVKLPHDWTTEQNFTGPGECNGESKQSETVWENPTMAVERGYILPKTGYYRKVFSVSEESQGHRIFIEFEGVMRDSTVWVNGCYIGRHLSGYSAFAYDIADYLFYGKEQKNVILVKADTSCTEGWWTEGAGIYRNVWIRECEEQYIPRNGIFVYSDGITSSQAKVHIKTSVYNDHENNIAGLTLVQSIYKENEVISVNTEQFSVGALKETVISSDLLIRNPKLWDLENPNLYTLETKLLNDSRVIDCETTKFGIRDISYTEEGLMLNGRRIEIKGVCVHQDFAVVGSALNEDICRYRLQKIKEMGANTYRSAHNPADNTLLSLCDEMGILVLNENRRFESSEEGIEELRELMEGSRNHPCIFMWSLENEELISTLSNGKQILRRLVKYAHRFDPTRQCTVAGHYACRDEEYVKIPDVAGFNYDMNDAKAMREAIPGLLTIASEDGSFVSGRGVYKDDRSTGVCESYDSGSYMIKIMMEKMGITELPAGTLGGASSPNDLTYSWNHYRNEAQHLNGMFIWSAFDYRGESFPWNWPAVRSQYGAMDTCGLEKDAFYYWKSIWNSSPIVHVIPHWNHVKENVQVDIYSNCAEVELFINDISVCRAENQTGKVISKNVTYIPGILKAVGYDSEGKVIAEDCRKTAGKPDHVNLKKIFEGKKQVMFEADVMDENNILCPTESCEIKFTVKGGKIIGCSNGSPSDHDTELTDSKKAFSGKLFMLAEKEEEVIEADAAFAEK